LVRPLIPAGLELDTFDGAAWIGLIPFEICNLRGLPDFPETNVRTYVIGPDGSRAVWFFSLDADRLLAVAGARIGYRLPYMWASMRVTSENGSIRYRSRRRLPHSTSHMTDILIKPGALYNPSELTERDHFYTARYRLYSATQQRLNYAQIDHPPWPLARAEVLELRENLTEAAHLPSPRGHLYALCCAELSVRIGWLRHD